MVSLVDNFESVKDKQMHVNKQTRKVSKPETEESSTNLGSKKAPFISQG